MKKEINDRIIKIMMDVIAVIIIAFFAYSLTPKTFQNDTFYTIKIGEHLENSVGSASGYLPWNNKIDFKDPFSIHKDLPYTYPHWLYDLLTYKIYKIDGLSSVYMATCILAVILGLSIYFVNRKLNKNIIISTLITIASMYCLKDFIAARAQLVTFILFVFTIYGIEQFIATRKIRYAVLLLIIPIIIANVHSAVWIFYFVLYLPYLAELFINTMAITNWNLLKRKLILTIRKNKMTKEQYTKEMAEVEKIQATYDENVNKKLNETYKLKFKREKNTKWLIPIIIIALFTGILTPIKNMPYMYTILTMQGNSMNIISEHLPLTLINNVNMITILVITIGILTFTKTKIKIRDFFMLLGLIILSFSSQRQVSMLVIAGNFILARLIYDLLKRGKEKFKIKATTQVYINVVTISIIAIFVNFVALNYCIDKKNDVFIDESSYPVGAADYITNTLMPELGKENIRIYNDYNYGSYLLYRGIPVFIDSRADLYLPEFNGEKDQNGKYVGIDIMTDFLDISGIACNYESKFEEYDITHAVLLTNSKLNSLISKDINYKQLYKDDYFVIYERGNR